MAYSFLGMQSGSESPSRHAQKQESKGREGPGMRERNV